MITPQELRIGNLVIDTETPYGNKVFNIDFQGINRWSDMGAGGCCKFDKIQPIPLTEEWFLKCGFEKDGSLYKIEMNEGEFIELDQDGDANYHLFIRQIDINEEHSLVLLHRNINYLHQLQNLYYALTGKELNIKL